MSMQPLPRRIHARAVVLRLYVAGDGPNSVEARTNLERFLASQSEHEVTVEVVDVLAHPQRGIDDAVVVTPTLVRVRPRPEQRIIGNLRGRTVLLATLIRDGESDD